MTSTLLLDVDGVINALSSTARLKSINTGWSDDSWRKVPVYVPSDGQAYTITYSTELVDAINELNERDDVEIIWLTTWRDYANTSLAPELGLNVKPWRVIGSDSNLSSGFIWWKLLELSRFEDTELLGNIVWVDDDHRWYKPDVKSFIQSRQDAVSVVCPDSTTGLTRDLWNFILDSL